MLDATFFKQELAKVPGPKQVMSTRVMIVCPYHNDTGPSGGIWIGASNPGRIGRYRCFGCGKTATWDELADTLGLTKLNGAKRLPNVSKIDLGEIRQNVMGKREDPNKLVFFDLREPRWRGFSKEFLETLGAKLLYDDNTGYFYVWFPVVVKGKEAGYIRAQIKKSSNKNVPSYLNKPGDWVKKRGLFPFDTAIQLMRGKGLKTMVLVEGPRDALRLILAGIPAVAIMGTQNWSSAKRLLLETSGVERVVLCMDGDSAGRDAARNIYPQIKPFLETRVFKLWDVAKAAGLKKMDPCSAPRSVRLRIKSLLK